MARSKTNALKELKTKTTRTKTAKATGTAAKKTSVTAKTRVNTNMQGELNKANKRITLLETRLQTFINLIHKEMNNELLEGPKALSKKISRANLLN